MIDSSRRTVLTTGAAAAAATTSGFGRGQAEAEEDWGAESVARSGRSVGSQLE
jgi:hypothetical protein